MREESTRTLELESEGHSLFISGQKHNLNGQRQVSKLLIASLLLAVTSIFFPNISGA